VKNDNSIERPARKISMIDGYAEEKTQAEAQTPAAEEVSPETQGESEEKSSEE